LQVFIVTGANTGIGYLVASFLYSANATVYVAARTESKATTAINSIKSFYPNSKGTLHFLKLDLSDLSTIKASAEEFLGREDRLDVLWNNAGVMIPGADSQGAQGYELQYVTNVLGPFMFTKLLLPTLKKTAAESPKGAVRVCWASSLATDLMTSKRGITFTEEGSPMVKGNGGGTPEYGISKVANYFLGYEFAKRFGNRDGVFHNVSVHVLAPSSCAPPNRLIDWVRTSSLTAPSNHPLSSPVSSSHSIQATSKPTSNDTPALSASSWTPSRHSSLNGCSTLPSTAPTQSSTQGCRLTLPSRRIKPSSCGRGAGAGLSDRISRQSVRRAETVRSCTSGVSGRRGSGCNQLGLDGR
jgi:NAD(P)-dependent dehydrogenase (short-subunit alcohol dehydrogenase family)